MILSGDIYLTDDIDLVHNIMSYPPSSGYKIISLDEDGVIDITNPNVIGGSILLPPIDCLIAEQDGDEAEYDRIYDNFFHTQDIFYFMAAIIESLVVGVHLLMYYKSVDADCMTTNKLSEHIFKNYGIYIGNLRCSAPFYYLEDYTPMWVYSLYKCKFISPYEYLYNMPMGVNIPEDVMEELIDEIKPYATNNMNARAFIYDMLVKLKDKPNLICPLFKINQGGL